MDKIKYLAHPVTKEDKLKYRAEGYRVIDIRFAPEGYEDKPKRTRKPKQDK